MRKLAQRWLPESWLESRVDPGRAGLLGLSLLGVVALVVVIAALWSSEPAAEPASLPVAAPVVSPPASAPPDDKLVVSVVGRVARPGLVTVKAGARVADALDAAGGALAGTDILALNLARRLIDGEQLYVAVPVPPNASAPEQPGKPGGQGGDKLDLNTATAAELDALPGVGKVTAERIVQWRTEHARFASVDQLREVGGIGDARFSKLRELVRT